MAQKGDLLHFPKSYRGPAGATVRDLLTKLGLKNVVVVGLAHDGTFLVASDKGMPLDRVNFLLDRAKIETMERAIAKGRSRG